MVETKEESKGLALIDQFESKLSTAVESGDKKIPQWQKKDIIAMKEQHLGNLKTQIQYLKSNKKTEFISMYDEDIKNIDREISTEYEKYSRLLDTQDNLFLDAMVINVTNAIKRDYSKFLKDLDKNAVFVESNCPNEKALRLMIEIIHDSMDKEMSIEDKKTYILDYENKIKNSIRCPIQLKKKRHDLRKVVGLLFELNYDKAYSSAKNEIERLEKLFIESLNFNDMKVAYLIYQELKKADSLLDMVSKYETPKINVNLRDFIDIEEVRKLEIQYENQKRFQFQQSENNK